VAVVVFTCVLAFVNIYVKTAAPVEFRLRVFLNLAFALYAAVCGALALVAYMLLQTKISNVLLLILTSAVAGVLAGNTEVKFAGQGLQPLVKLIQQLEAMVDTAVAAKISSFDIAERAKLRDQLTGRVPEVELERELLLLGDDTTPETLKQFRQKAGDRNDVYRGHIAKEIIRRSEVNARRLLSERANERKEP